MKDATHPNLGYVQNVIIQYFVQTMQTLVNVSIIFRTQRILSTAYISTYKITLDKLTYSA